ncbi:transcription initiation factor IIA subunit 1 [Neocloeon triangulifer]|uniref:transcription initiation factor IIA subunit 1 n=1 Tax=Neocloeon triangulifer TaxID=2078957 RepID=UPI00286FABFF|nr:transcription initiation factor IIA subunit 1 [Neocloeon triangulifer]
MAICQTSVKRLYQSVIDDVILNIKDTFLDEGVDEQVLTELKQMWETKLSSLRALEPLPEPPEPQPPTLSTHMRSTNQTMNAVKTTNAIPHQTVTKTAAPALVAVTSNSTPTTATTSAALPTAGVTTIPDLGRMVPIQITLPPQPGSAETQPRVLNIQVPAAALQGNQLHQILSGPVMTATLALPPVVASSLLQTHILAALQGQAQANTLVNRTVTAQAIPVTQAATTVAAASSVAAQQAQQRVFQVDGLGDSSDDDIDDDDDGDDDDDDADSTKDDSAGEESGGNEEEPLNSGDDVSDEDVAEQFDTDNVVVCQYDKVTRSRNRWKFYLKDGIMNLNGRDFVFQKANGDAEW